MSNLQVGQKVVRVKIDPEPGPRAKLVDIGDFAEVGCIYEVRWIGMYKFISGEFPAVRLVEIKRVTQNPDKKSEVYLDVPWAQKYFRPLQESKIPQAVSKGLDIFRKIAKDVTEGKVVKIDEEV